MAYQICQSIAVDLSHAADGFLGITGVSRFLKEKDPAVRIVGAQPSEGSRIPGIRKGPEAYLPKIYEPSRVDELVYVSQADAEEMARRMAREEGLFGGISGPARCGPRCRWRSRSRTRRSCSSSATAATATCPPACSRPERRMAAEPRYCPQCAAPLAWRVEAEDGGDKSRLRCPRCDYTHWNNPTPVLAAVIECADRGGRVLLARNAAWSGRMFALITGFMEAGEIAAGRHAARDRRGDRAAGRRAGAHRRLRVPEAERFAAYRDAGVNRLSLGIQSFNNAIC